jgi:hypothetical protein
MGISWGHSGMCAIVMWAARSWSAHAVPRSSPVFAGSRSSSMSVAGGVSHGSVVSQEPGIAINTITTQNHGARRGWDPSDG